MLKVINVKKSYKKKMVLEDVSFEVEKGKITALIGENGSGKSTLIEIICGIKKANSGEVFFKGLNVFNKKNKIKTNKSLGYMPQNFILYQDLTVFENLSYVASVYSLKNKDRVNEVLKECFLEDNKNVLAGNLSGGYKQLLSMASAMLYSPEFLILDEPTSAMDPIFRKRFWQVIKNLNQNGTTILLITHYIEELLECDNFLCLSKGKIKYSGSVKEFMQNGFVDIESILKKFDGEE